jgi:hypothetical protein
MCAFKFPGAQLNRKEEHRILEGESVGVIAPCLHLAINEINGLQPPERLQGFLNRLGLILIEPVHRFA